MNQSFTVADISEIRRLITRPTMKTSLEAREAFILFAKEKYKIDDLASENGRAFQAALRKWGAGSGLLDYMGFSV